MSSEKKLPYADDLNTVEKFLKEQDEGIMKNEVSFWFSKRFLIAVLIFFGYFNLVLLKVNLNISVVEMTSKKKISSGNSTTTNEEFSQPEFDWDSKTMGMVLSMHAYGYLTCVGAGYVVSKIGGATAYGLAILAMATMNLITPVCLRANFYLFLITRLFIGALDGVAYAGSMEILSRWAPIHERSIMLAISFCGIYIGIATSYPVDGFLAQKWGWSSTFYVAGAVAIIWYIFWISLVKNQPSKDTRISKKELEYILENTDTAPRNQIVHPYREIFTSPQVWALCIGEFAYGWGFTLLVTCFPLYVKDMTGRDIDEVGFIASIPNIVCMFMIPIAGIIMDFWQNNSNFKRTQIHKIMMSVGFFSGSLCLTTAAFISNFTLSMICFVLIKLMISFNYLILQLVCLSMSPMHSGVLAGVSAFWYTVSNIMIPNTVGFIVQNHNAAEWSACFLVSATVLFFGAVTFIVYGSSELQPWSMSLPCTDIEEKSGAEIKNEKFSNT
ncbi:vesicular glutamate transporter 2-like [Planococcus citri]|uniref:vesicular glutamate transporter 2-like n=1 Tax=Planococcus citri TaxID=170843 RepID=UPI0031F902A7